MTGTGTPGTDTPVPPASGSGQRSAVLGEHQSSAASKDSGSKPERAKLAISRPSTSGPGGSSFDLALILGPLAFLAFLFVIRREVRRAR